jgi:hypothetical protein
MYGGNVGGPNTRRFIISPSFPKVFPIFHLDMELALIRAVSSPSASARGALISVF